MDNEIVVQNNAVQVIQPLQAHQARLNITWQGNNGDLLDPVAFDSGDGDVKAWAAEAVRGGNVPGIPADANVDFRDFIVDRFDAGPEVQYNRLFLRPKTPFGV